MRILLNALQAGNRSGTGRYTVELARRLPYGDEGLDYLVLWPKGLPHPPMAADSHEAFFEIPVPSAFRRVYMDQVGIGDFCRKNGVNLIHYPANIGRMVSLHNMVVTVHDLSFVRHPEWFLPGRAFYYRHAVARSVNRAARVVADSACTANDLHELLGIQTDRIDIVPLGVDGAFQPAGVDEVSAVRRKYALPESFLLFMATLEPRKNVPALIAAWNRVAPDIPADLVIAGREGWKAEGVIEAIERSPSRSRIHRIGFVAPEDQAALLTAAHAFVWPVLWEGFGLPPLEAMACGTPVLTSDTSSLPEVVGDAAIRVDPADEDAIAQGILDLCRDHSLRDRLRDAGLRRSALFTWERTAELTAAVYRKVLHI